MIEWKYIAVPLCFFLLIFLLAKEAKRKNKSGFAMRIFATVAVVVSLSCLAFPIFYTEKVATTNSNEVIVLTDGYDTDSVLTFLSKHESKTPVITFDKSLYDKHEFAVQLVPDIYSLSQENNISNFHLFGFGFDKNDLNRLPQSRLFFHPSPLPSGIDAINWSNQLASGKKLLVQGQYSNASPSKTKIILAHFGMVLDSAYITANKKEPFSLSTIPKGEGRTTYSLTAITNKDTIEKETLPVEVGQGKKISVLILSSSPDFNSKFLKNELAGQGNSVVSRTTISKNKYASDYLNTQQISLDHITVSLLNHFAILIADATALSSLPKSEEAIIQAQVARQGLGLIIKGDSAVTSSFYSAMFPAKSGLKDSVRLLNLSLSDTSIKLPSLAAVNSFFIGAGNAQPLVQDKQNKVYTSTALWGVGKIVFTSLQNTFLWALSGHEEAYNQYWSVLLNKALTTSPEEEVWQVFPAIAVTNEPAVIQLQTNSDAPPQALVNGVAVHLKNNSDLPYLWTGIYYPQREGWQAGVGMNGKPWYWYAYLASDWQNVSRSQKIIATKQYISTNLYKEKHRANRVTKQTELPFIYIYLLLLISCGYLWWERKKITS